MKVLPLQFYGEHRGRFYFPRLVSLSRRRFLSSASPRRLCAAPARDKRPLRRPSAVRPGRYPAMARADRANARLQGTVGEAGDFASEVRSKRYSERLSWCVVLPSWLSTYCLTFKLSLQVPTRPNQLRRSSRRSLRTGTRRGGSTSETRASSSCSGGCAANSILGGAGQLAEGVETR